MKKRIEQEAPVSLDQALSGPTLKSYFNRLNLQHLGFILNAFALLGIIITLLFKMGGDIVWIGSFIIIVAILFIELVLILYTLGTVFIFAPNIVSGLWNILVGVFNGSETLNQILNDLSLALPWVGLATILLSGAATLVLHFSHLQCQKKRHILNLIFAASALILVLLSLDGGA